MKFTQMAKANEIERSWVVVDAEGKKYSEELLLKLLQF